MTDVEREPGGRIVPRVTFAWNCGCTEQTLRRWVAAGMPGALPDGRIDVRLAHKWVVARQAERLAVKAVKGAGGKSAEELKRQILAVELARKTIARDREKAEAARDTGDMVSLAASSAAWADAIIELRTDLLAVGARLGALLGGRPDTREIVGLVDRLIRASLTRISTQASDRLIEPAAVADAARLHPDEDARKAPYEHRLRAFGHILHGTILDAARKARKAALPYIMLRTSDGSPLKGPDGVARVIFVADGEVCSMRSDRVKASRDEYGDPQPDITVLRAWINHAALFAGLPALDGYGLSKSEVVDFVPRERMRQTSYGRSGGPHVTEAEVDALIAEWNGK